VRAALGLKEGDEIAYAIEEGRVVLTRAEQSKPEDPFATFDEWDSAADRKAYGRLSARRYHPRPISLYR
jgi:antitoxin PrlF